MNFDLYKNEHAAVPLKSESVQRTTMDSGVFTPHARTL